MLLSAFNLPTWVGFLLLALLILKALPPIGRSWLRFLRDLDAYRNEKNDSSPEDH